LVLIFLGAGASVPFGYPTMVGLQNELIRRVGDKQRGLLVGLPSVAGGIDAEVVLQHIAAIEALSERGLERIFEEARITFYGTHGKETMGFLEFVNLCRTLREEIEDVIFDVYQFRPEIVDKFRLYGQLFSTIASATKAREHHIYTTNYDKIIEEFCTRTEGYQIVDGFEYDSKIRSILWKPSLFNSPLPDVGTPLKLFKLHGSLDWKSGENGIERVAPEVRLKQPTAVHKKDILIYPGSKEATEQEPFRTLYERFETEMKETDRCLVIGFSFRDLYLNRIFRDFVHSGKGQLLVMSKNCGQIVAEKLLNLRQSTELEKYVDGNNVGLIPCHFGEGDWLTALQNTLLGIPFPIEKPKKVTDPKNGTNEGADKQIEHFLRGRDITHNG
jgi:hypothetical protein